MLIYVDLYCWLMLIYNTHMTFQMFIRGHGPARPQMLPGWLRLWVQPGQASVQRGAGGDVTCGPRVRGSDDQMMG